MTDRNTMDDVVEKLARKLCDESGQDPNMAIERFVGDTLQHSHWAWEDWVESASNIIRWFEENGLVLVPREATEEMKRAAAGHGLAFPDEAGEIWSAMIAASSKGER